MDQDKVKYVANLARIGISEDEAERFGKDLESILNYVNKLKEINTDSSEAVSNITGMENAIRQDDGADIVRNVHPDPAILRDMAPDKEAGHIKVRQILGKK